MGKGAFFLFRVKFFLLAKAFKIKHDGKKMGSMIYIKKTWGEFLFETIFCEDLIHKIEGHYPPKQRGQSVSRRLF